MTDTIKKIIDERELDEALQSRYSNTIIRHKWNNLENARLSTIEMIQKYISECDEEDTGVYRNHKYIMTPYQRYWHKWLMEKQYKYMITIKLPHSMIDGFKRTYNQSEAVKQIRQLIREIEQAYTGHKHWERDCFDFNNVFEHGKSGFWHMHLVVVGNTMNYETTYNKLQKAIDNVLQQHKLFKTCIKLTYVYDQEGLCEYLVKELEEPPADIKLNKNYSYLSSLYNLFHIQIKEKQNIKLCKVIKMVSDAVKSKQERALFKPNPIHKLNTDKIRHSRLSFKQARTSRK